MIDSSSRARRALVPARRWDRASRRRAERSGRATAPARPLRRRAVPYRRSAPGARLVWQIGASLPEVVRAVFGGEGADEAGPSGSLPYAQLKSLADDGAERTALAPRDLAEAVEELVVRHDRRALHCHSYGTHYVTTSC